MIPIIPPATKNFILTPAINSKAIMAITKITPVPRSGCNMINPKKSKVILKIGKTPFL